MNSVIDQDEAALAAIAAIRKEAISSLFGEEKYLAIIEAALKEQEEVIKIQREELNKVREGYMLLLSLTPHWTR